MSHKQKQLFKTKIVPGKAGSGKLFEEKFVVDDGPVECFGMTFENDEKRREHFLEKLREKLNDPNALYSKEPFAADVSEGMWFLTDSAGRECRVLQRKCVVTGNGRIPRLPGKARWDDLMAGN